MDNTKKKQQYVSTNEFRLPRSPLFLVYSFVCLFACLFILCSFISVFDHLFVRLFLLRTIDNFRHLKIVTTRSDRVCHCLIRLPHSASVVKRGTMAGLVAMISAALIKSERGKLSSFGLQCRSMKNSIQPKNW